MFREHQEKESEQWTIHTNWKQLSQAGNRNTTVTQNWFCLGHSASILPSRQGARDLHRLSMQKPIGHFCLHESRIQGHSATLTKYCLACSGKSPQRSLQCDWNPATVFPTLVCASYCLSHFDPSSPICGILAFSVFFSSKYSSSSVFLSLCYNLGCL